MTEFLGFSMDKSPNCMYCNRLYNIQQANRKAIAMTDCTTNQLVFSSLGRRKIQADFKGGRLTSYAGALSLREADKRLGLIDAINNCVPDPRHPREICGLGECSHFQLWQIGFDWVCFG